MYLGISKLLSTSPLLETSWSGEEENRRRYLPPRQQTTGTYGEQSA